MNNTLKNKLLIFGFLLIGLVVYAKTQTATIKSSMVCQMCEDNIRNGLIYEKGIKKITFNLDENEIYVKFNPKQTTLEEIKKKITLLGYAADELPADKEAFDALAGCCKTKDANCK